MSLRTVWFSSFYLFSHSVWPERDDGGQSNGMIRWVYSQMRGGQRGLAGTWIRLLRSPYHCTELSLWCAVRMWRWELFHLVIWSKLISLNWAVSSLESGVLCNIKNSRPIPTVVFTFAPLRRGVRQWDIREDGKGRRGKEAIRDCPFRLH